MSELISQFHFLRPTALLLAVPVIVIWWFWQRGSDPLEGWRKQIAPDLLQALVEGKESSARGPVKWVLAGWLLAVVLIAGPTWRLEPSPFAEDATPLLVLLKADVSMDTPDPAPSRLKRAHLKIADLANARKGQPLGLIAYAGSAHVVLPPTRDTDVVAEMANEISPAIMPVSGDRLDLALREATRVLGRADRGGTVVVITDEVDTDPAALREAARQFDYPVQFLQIRSPETPVAQSFSSAAKTLRASVEVLSVDDRDIESIVRRAARAPVAQSGDGSDRWEDSGYWFLPLLGILLLFSFRRTESGEVPA